MIGRNDPCCCGSGKKWKKCHFPEPAPEKVSPFEGLSYEKLAENYYKRYGILVKTPKQISGIREACRLAVDILEKTCEMAKEGVTTLELNNFAHKLHLDAGAVPAPLGYGTPPFPRSICTSINEVICHGIPDNTLLRNGDIVNIDVTCILNGYFGDCSKMVEIGSVDREKKLVVDVAHDALMKSCEILKPGIPIFHIGEVIQSYAELHGCSVVTKFVAHGVGLRVHEPPQIPHYRNTLGILLVPGMTFTIEPMINAGKNKAVIDARDMWTARTIDKKPSAQWEHTLLITESGHEILTPWVRDSGKR